MKFMVIKILIELQLHLSKILLDTELTNTLKLLNFKAEKKSCLSSFVAKVLIQLELKAGRKLCSNIKFREREKTEVL